MGQAGIVSYQDFEILTLFNGEPLCEHRKREPEIQIGVRILAVDAANSSERSGANAEALV